MIHTQISRTMSAVMHPNILSGGQGGHVRLDRTFGQRVLAVSVVEGKIWRRSKKLSVLLSYSRIDYIATMSGQFFPGSCGDLNPAVVVVCTCRKDHYSSIAMSA